MGETINKIAIRPIWIPSPIEKKRSCSNLKCCSSSFIDCSNSSSSSSENVPSSLYHKLKSLPNRRGIGQNYPEPEPWRIEGRTIKESTHEGNRRSSTKIDRKKDLKSRSRGNDDHEKRSSSSEEKRQSRNNHGTKQDEKSFRAKTIQEKYPKGFLNVDSKLDRKSKIYANLESKPEHLEGRAKTFKDEPSKKENKTKSHKQDRGEESELIRGTYGDHGRNDTTKEDKDKINNVNHLEQNGKSLKSEISPNIFDKIVPNADPKSKPLPDWKSKWKKQQSTLEPIKESIGVETKSFKDAENEENKIKSSKKDLKLFRQENVEKAKDHSAKVVKGLSVKHAKQDQKSFEFKTKQSSPRTAHRLDHSSYWKNKWRKDLISDAKPEVKPDLLPEPVEIKTKGIKGLEKEENKSSKQNRKKDSKPFGKDYDGNGKIIPESSEIKIKTLKDSAKEENRNDYSQLDRKLNSKSVERDYAHHDEGHSTTEEENSQESDYVKSEMKEECKAKHKMSERGYCAKCQHSLDGTTLYKIIRVVDDIKPKYEMRVGKDLKNKDSEQASRQHSSIFTFEQGGYVQSIDAQTSKKSKDKSHSTKRGKRNKKRSCKNLKEKPKAKSIKSLKVKSISKEYRENTMSKSSSKDIKEKTVKSTKKKNFGVQCKRTASNLMIPIHVNKLPNHKINVIYSGSKKHKTKRKNQIVHIIENPNRKRRKKTPALKSCSLEEIIVRDDIRVASSKRHDSKERHKRKKVYVIESPRYSSTTSPNNSVHSLRRKSRRHQSSYEPKHKRTRLENTAYTPKKQSKHHSKNSYYNIYQEHKQLMNNYHANNTYPHEGYLQPDPYMASHATHYMPPPMSPQMVHYRTPSSTPPMTPHISPSMSPSPSTPITPPMTPPKNKKHHSKKAHFHKHSKKERTHCDVHENDSPSSESDESEYVHTHHHKSHSKKHAKSNDSRPPQEQYEYQYPTHQPYENYPNDSEEQVPNPYPASPKYSCLCPNCAQKSPTSPAEPQYESTPMNPHSQENAHTCEAIEGAEQTTPSNQKFPRSSSMFQNLPDPYGKNVSQQSSEHYYRMNQEYRKNLIGCSIL